MDSDKKAKPESDAKPSEVKAPADALSRTPEELAEDKAVQEAAIAAQQIPEKKVSPIKKFFRKINVYFLVFILIVIVAGAVTIVNYLNSQTPTPEAAIANQGLTENALKQLANTDATVGQTSQTLTIQGNAIIAGQTLMRGNLNVAGNFQTGGSIQAPTLTISGQSNLGATQINSLQVATNTAVQGSTTLRDLSVSGASTFSGPVTASQLTVTQLTIAGNGILQIPNHLSFTGPTPDRSINGGVLGGGGTVSVSGSDTAGVVNINTGNNPTAGCFTRITFRQPFASQPRVMISPVGPGAGLTQYYVDRNNTGFSICASTPAPGNQAFAFDYFVAG